MAISDRDYERPNWHDRVRESSITLALGMIAALIIFFVAISLQFLPRAPLAGDGPNAPSVQPSPQSTPSQE